MFSWIKKLGSRTHKAPGNFFFEIEVITGYKPVKKLPYELAFRHSSASREDKGLRMNNQRLEFLGDAILGAVVAEHLYKKYPEAQEGFLTGMRSKIVSRKHLNEIGNELNISKLIIKKTAPQNIPKSITGDTFEALIGALYLDHGYEAACRFVEKRVLQTYVDFDSLETRIASHKSALLEWCQKNRMEACFELDSAWGQSHARNFKINFVLNGKVFTQGTGTSKKRAEEEAAQKAYKELTGGNEVNT